LRCNGLVKKYGDVTAVNGLDLEVRAGECFGLLGPNGAGKTTTVEIFEG
jgi:ABC-2 type transport system ATP-binding protein